MGWIIKVNSNEWEVRSSMQLQTQWRKLVPKSWGAIIYWAEKGGCVTKCIQVKKLAGLWPLVFMPLKQQTILYLNINCVRWRVEWSSRGDVKNVATIRLSFKVLEFFRLPKSLNFGVTGNNMTENRENWRIMIVDFCCRHGTYKVVVVRCL